MELKHQVRSTIEEGRDIVFVDECMFTFSTLPKKAYAAKGMNVDIDPKDGHSETVALLAGIDAVHGMVYYDIFSRSVDQDKFIKFANGLKEHLGDRPAAIFMDNLAVHRCKSVMHEL